MVAKLRSQNGQAQNDFFSVERAMPGSLSLRTPPTLSDYKNQSASTDARRYTKLLSRRNWRENTVLSFLVVSETCTQNVILISFAEIMATKFVG